MRIIFCFLFFTIILFEIYKSAADNDEERYEPIVDTKVVEYDDNDDVVEESSNKKQRVKVIKNFVGTNLFGEVGSRKKCFSMEDIALLAARRDLESLIPKDLPNSLLDDELAKILIQYFYGANQVIDKMASGKHKMFAQKAFYDTLGGYLNYYMIPISRYSYYAGLVKLRTIQNILELYSQCKSSINTNGNDWKAPLRDFTDLDTQIEPLRIVVRNEEEDTSCIQLDMLDEHSGEDDDMIVSLPRLDPGDKGLLGNIWLPFKRKPTFNLQSCMSAFVLLRYFELTTRCYSFQGVCQDTFNKKFKDWILENLEIHFGDDILYPGLGAMLRIVETLRRKTKDIVVTVPKTNSKRQKVQSIQIIANTAPPLDQHTQGSVKDVFGDKLRDEMLAKTEMDIIKERRLKYIFIGIGVAVFILILVFLGIVVALYKRCHNKYSTAEEITQTPPPKRRKFNYFGRNASKDDEEELLNSKKSSFKFKSKPSKKEQNSPAIIETSSMDSDSGRDSKKKKRGKTPSPAKPPVKSKMTKTVTVDEKKRFSISKKKKDERGAAEKRVSYQGDIHKKQT